MRSATLALLLATILAGLPFAGGAAAHPGPVGADGCHVCRHRCARYGLPNGARHCHPERLGAKGGRADEGVEREVGTITKVSDGDTFHVQTAAGEIKVRVLGIDCPESSHNAKCERDGRQGRDSCDVQVPRGVAAKRRAADLLDGRKVTLEGPFSRDPFGRRLAYIRMADGQDYGLLMIREGRCEDFGWKYPHPRGTAYRAASGR